MKALLAAFALAMATFAQAHEGHGPQGEHWHATDAWGFVLLALVIAVWFGRRR